MSVLVKRKGKNFLRDLYKNAVSAATIRKTPVTIEELKYAGMTNSAIEHYFELIKILYAETLFVQHEVYSSDEDYEPEALRNAWTKLELFCCNQNLIERDVFSDGSLLLYCDMMDASEYSIIEHYTEYPWDIFVRSFDEFRRFVEIELSGIDLALELIHSKYGVQSHDEISDDINFYTVFYRVNPDSLILEELSYDDLCELADEAQQDVKEIKDSLDKFSAMAKMLFHNDNVFRLNSRFTHSWTKDIPALMDTYHLLKKCEQLLIEAKSYAWTLENEDEPWEDDDDYDNDSDELEANTDYPDRTLYIHKGRIICQKKYHDVVQATAILSDKSGNDIKLNVSYCRNCQKFFMHYDVYRHYRQKYGVILGDLRMLKHDDFHGDDAILADESPLKLCGYSVGKQAGLSEFERRTIIINCIETGCMTKAEVINLLRWLIEVNGAKKGNEEAVSKWTRDLDFTLAYNIDSQQRVGINKITKYQNRFYVGDSADSVSIPRKKPTIKRSSSDLLGKRISHIIWGEGTVIDQTSEYVTVNFFNGTIKDILLSSFEDVAEVL